MDFSLKKFGLGGRSDSVIGIDIGTSSAKVIQIRNKGGKAILETYGELALGPYAKKSVGQAVNLEEDKLAEALKDLMRESNVTTKEAALSIPLKSSLVKIIQIPKFKEKELGKIIPIEARKYIPVPISEVALDWQVIPSQHFQNVNIDEEEKDDDQEKIEVLIVAIHNETLNKYGQIAKDVGLSNAVFEVETFSTVRTISTHDIVPVAILDLGASTSKLTIIDYGVVKVSHTINKGAQDLTLALSQSLGMEFEQAEMRKRKNGLADSSVSEQQSTAGVMSSNLDYIFYEASKVVSDFERKYSRLVSRVELTGGGALLLGVKEVAQKKFDVEVSVGNAFSKLEAPAFLANTLRNAGPEFTISIGLALRKLQELG